MGKEEKLVIDVLEDDWKKVYLFVKKNQKEERFEQISRFANALSLFKFDTIYKHPKKQVFIHHSGEWATSTRPWKPCERSVIFEKLDDGVAVCIASKVDGQKRVDEQSLQVRQKAEGEYVGMFSKLNEDNTRTEYAFGIAKSGLIKARTFKKLSNNKEKTK